MRASRFRARFKHEVRDDKLTSSVKKLGECLFPVRSFKHVLFPDRLPWQLAPLLVELVLQPRELLLLRQKRRPRREPLLVRYHRVILDNAVVVVFHALTSSRKWEPPHHVLDLKNLSEIPTSLSRGSFPQFIRMLIQYVLDSYITSMLLYPLIVSRQLARFASPLASLRCLGGRCLPRPGRGVSALYSYRFFSPNIGRERPISRKILAAKLFRISTHFARFLCRLSPFRMNTSKSVSKQRTLSIFKMNTYEKRRRGWPVMVNQESVKDSCPERPSGVKDLHVAQPLLAVLFPQVTGHRARNSATPRIMCAPLQESTPCAIASSAAPDGTSVKLVTACGDSLAGPAPTMLNRSTPSSAPSISAAISLTPRGPTVTVAASRSSEKFCAPIRTIPVSAVRTRNSTSPRKFRPKTANGPAAAISPSTIAIPPTTSKNTSTKASLISASKNSTSSSFTLGKIAGSPMNASRARWKSCARPAKPKPSASALIAGNRTTAFAPCSNVSPTPSRSSTTFSTK